jgi:putative ABC transport system substrate-binding protein
MSCGGAASAMTSRRGQAQPASPARRVGLLIPFPESDAASNAAIAAFRDGLAALGWRDGSTIAIEARWSGADAERMRAVAKELVALNPDVILVRSTAATAVLLKETRAIPIVFVVVSDPVGDRFVESMARPGGNATGFTSVEASLGGKWLELLKEIAPGIARVAVMFGARTAAGGGTFYLSLIEAAAASIGVSVEPLPLGGAADIAPAIAAFARAPQGGLIVAPDLTTQRNRKAIHDSAALHGIPAVYPYRFDVAEGGLASYGIDIPDLFRRAATYVDRILKGARPGELPVQAPVKFELGLNLTAAKALGLSISPALLARADEVIE